MYLRFLLVVFTLLSGLGPAYSQGVSTGAPYDIGLKRTTLLIIRL